VKKSSNRDARGNRIDVARVLGEMLCARDDVRVGNMFGLPAFYAGARVFACVSRDGVGLKLPAERASQLLNRPDVRSFRPFNKPATREWIESYCAHELRRVPGEVLVASTQHKGDRTMMHNRIVSQDEWLAARKQHLVKEKEFTRLRDELSGQRRELPWVKVEKRYVFDGPNGMETLADLFDGRSQLIVYHFMFGPGWEEGCRSCSLLADHVDGAVVHLAQRDVTLMAASRAPLAQIQAFKERMGWRFKWVSSYGNHFNFDYHVSFTKDQMAKGKTYYNYKVRETSNEGEAPGTSVFYKDGTGEVFHTYSSYGRGLDVLIGAYNYLDLVPKGRDEDALAFTMEWVRHHDRYAAVPKGSDS